MSISTFSGPIRVGKKPYSAGVTKLILSVDANDLGITNNILPPGSIVLGGVASANAVEVMISDGSSTANIITVTAGVYEDASGIEAKPITGPGVVEVTASAVEGYIHIEYFIPDSSYGVNG